MGIVLAGIMSATAGARAVRLDARECCLNERENELDAFEKKLRAQSAMLNTVQDAILEREGLLKERARRAAAVAVVAVEAGAVVS